MSEEIDWGAPALRRRVLHAVGRGFHARAVRGMNRLGKYIVPASAALYVLGFCVCVLHYHRRGVPVQMLGHTQFIAAGVLFFVLSASAWLFGFWSVASSARRGSLRVVLSATVLWGMVFMHLGARAAAAVTLYWVIVAFQGWFASASTLHANTLRVVFSVTTKHPNPPDESNVGAIISPVVVMVWLFSTVLFTTHVFPTVPQWLGGGEPRPVSLFWSAPLSDAERQAVGAAEKECVFEVQSDSQYVYLMFPDAKDARCSPPARGWRKWIGLEDSYATRHYAVVRRERIASIVYR